MTRPLRVVVNAIPAANPVTGIGRYIAELYAAMHRIAGDELEVAYFDGRGLRSSVPTGPKNLRAFSALGRVFWSLPVPLALAAREISLHRREARFAALAIGFDVYHETAFFPFRCKPGIGVVQTVHDLSVQFHPEWHPAERVAFVRRHFAQRLEWSDEILVPSEFTRTELGRFVTGGVAPVVTTPLGVSARFRPASAEAVAEARARLGLPAEYVLCVGSGDPRKNIAAIEHLLDAGLGFPLVVAGWSGWLAPQCARADVHAVGYVEDRLLPALYSGARAFLFPSRYEGFGLPVLEAMACGAPVVVPDAHAMREVAGETGVYFDLDAPESFGRALRVLLDDPTAQARARKAGLRRAAEFTWERTARVTLAALERAVRRARPRD